MFKKSYRKKLIGATATASLVLGLGACASDPEDDYPERTIQVTAGWSAGGTSDLAARQLAQGLEEQLGVNTQVVNVEGATGGVGASQVYNEPADGYNLFAGASVHGLWGVMEQADVGPEDFFAFLAGPSPTSIYVRGDSDYETVDDLVEALEENPGMRYGSPGPGSNGHMFGEMFVEEAGVDAEHVPYDGGSEAGQYLMAGEIEFASVTLGDLLNLVDSEDARPLVNLYEEPLEAAGVDIDPITDYYPDLGPQAAINPQFGVYASRDTPPEIVEQISDAIEATVSDPEFQQWYEDDMGGIPEFNAGQEADEIMYEIESARSWALWDLGIAEVDPEEFDIPRLEDFSWPPHERAEGATEWP